jgi:hypothetical protein
MRHLWLLLAITSAGLGDSSCGGSHRGVIPHAPWRSRGSIPLGQAFCGVLMGREGGGSAGAEGDAGERPLWGMLAALSCGRRASNRRWACWSEAMRLRGGARNKKPPARSWKQHGMHHARKRKASLRNNRNSGRNKAYTVGYGVPFLACSHAWMLGGRFYFLVRGHFWLSGVCDRGGRKKRRRMERQRERERWRGREKESGEGMRDTFGKDCACVSPKSYSSGQQD